MNARRITFGAEAKRATGGTCVWAGDLFGPPILLALIVHTLQPLITNIMEEEIIEDLITRSYNDFSIVPCHWQLILGTRLLERRDLVGTAATGDGKT